MVHWSRLLQKEKMCGHTKVWKPLIFIIDTPVTVSSAYCHLASASGAWCQKLRDWGGASSLRLSGSLTQTQFHNIYKTQLVCTSLSIVLFIKSQYTVLHILFVLHFLFLFHCTFYSYFPSFYFLPICIYMLLCGVTFILFLHCPLSGPDLITFHSDYTLYNLVLWRINEPWDKAMSMPSTVLLQTATYNTT